MWSDIKTLSLKALEIDEMDADAHAFQGFLKSLYEYHWRDAEKHYIKEIQSASIAKDSKILFNETVANCARAIAEGKVTIANDCGPAQIAQMMNVPYVGIFSNYDGKAKGRIAEWFFQHENARAVTTDDLEDIRAIPVERIEKAVCQLFPKSD